MERLVPIEVARTFVSARRGPDARHARRPPSEATIANSQTTRWVKCRVTRPVPAGGQRGPRSRLALGWDEVPAVGAGRRLGGPAVAVAGIALKISATVDRRPARMMTSRASWRRRRAVAPQSDTPAMRVPRGVRCGVRGPDAVRVARHHGAIVAQSDLVTALFAPSCLAEPPIPAEVHKSRMPIGTDRIPQSRRTDRSPTATDHARSVLCAASVRRS